MSTPSILHRLLKALRSADPPDDDPASPPPPSSPAPPAFTPPASSPPIAGPLSYEEARELACHDDPEVRRALAAREDVRPEILYFLSTDPVAEVRREIALNQTTPVQADLRLASDSDPLVRCDLAQKIARLAPGLSADEQDRLRRMTYEALELLARDQITRVRQILAETLKDVANAPPALIRQLAHDSEISVSGPVLEFSPVLSDDDLLEIIHSSPAVGALSAISRRHRVSTDVADAIAYSDDAAAIGLLLGNPSAQIREETLDLLIDRATDQEAWHEPLVRRPQLSARAATRLARLVADALLRQLQERSDLDPATKAAVAAVVRRRVEEQGAVMAEFRPTAPPPPAEISEPAIETARRMHRSGRLEEPVILAALTVSDADFVISALAVRAELAPELVRAIIDSKSAKGIVALAWQAGLSMAIALQLQTRLARLAPPDLIRPRDDSPAFPLSAEEMAWQLKFHASHSPSGEPKALAMG